MSTRRKNKQRRNSHPGWILKIILKETQKILKKLWKGKQTPSAAGHCVANKKRCVLGRASSSSWRDNHSRGRFMLHARNLLVGVQTSFVIKLFQGKLFCDFSEKFEKQAWSRKNFQSEINVNEASNTEDHYYYYYFRLLNCFSWIAL